MYVYNLIGFVRSVRSLIRLSDCLVLTHSMSPVPVFSVPRSRPPNHRQHTALSADLVRNGTYARFCSRYLYAHHVQQPGIMRAAVAHSDGYWRGGGGGGGDGSEPGGVNDDTSNDIHDNNHDDNHDNTNHDATDNTTDNHHPTIVLPPPRRLDYRFQTDRFPSRKLPNCTCSSLVTVN